ncbi:MAG: pseudouridine synthase [Candidatus Wallbacteria bacterium]|nr:pseudouridine synthase [Candidatus Wallbacteria bacterium]
MAFLKPQKHFNKSTGVCPLYRALSKLSFCSRIKAKQLIRLGLVAVDGRKTLDPAQPVNFQRDRITVRGEIVKPKAFIYLALNKPVDFLVSRKRECGSRTIFELIPKNIDTGLRFAGRLDKDSRGLLILSNHNDFLNRISSDKENVAKFYRVKVDRELSESAVTEFEHGVEIKDVNGSKSMTLPCLIKSLGNRTYEIELRQGLNRQIRRMFEHFDSNVLDLFRYRIGKLEIGDLRESEFRIIRPQDVI